MEVFSSEERRSVVDESSSIVLSLLKRESVGAHCQELSERVRRFSERSLQKGVECSRRATEKWLSQALKGGASPAHRWCGKEDALHELPLVIRDSQGNFTADPQCVAELYAHEGKRERGGEDAIGFNKEISSMRALREKRVEEVRESAGNLDLGPRMFVKLVSLFRPRRRSVSISTHSKTSQSSLRTLRILQARSSDNVLSSWQHQPSHFCNRWSCWERRTDGAEQSPSYTPRIASPCVWFQRTSVNGMSSLLASVTLRSKVTQLSEHMHVARAAGIELAHSEGQYVIHFLWDMRKF